MSIKIISAGAGSGKTFRLASEMTGLLKGQGGEAVRASGVIATTFTNKAAAELQERVRLRLLEEGMVAEANELSNALIGTVHSLGVILLKRFAYEAGVSPEVEIMAEEDQKTLFNQSLANVLTNDRVSTMEDLCLRLGLHKRMTYDWRRDVLQLTEIARANDLSSDDLQKSNKKSIEEFEKFFPEGQLLEIGELNELLKTQLEITIVRLEENEDTTRKTEAVIRDLKSLLFQLETREYLFWHEWAKIIKLSPGIKSREDLEELQNLAARHELSHQFRKDIAAYISMVFDLGSAAIREFDRFKKQRGLIDFTDMEARVNQLLENPEVRSVLAREIDLLMVDEFQDTSPMQLAFFTKLSRLVHSSVWVGDPKQSIYGFRGADPRLMEAIIERTGGISPGNIQEFSWRSREDLVHLSNSLFTKAFPELPEEQVRLIPKRSKDAEPPGMVAPLEHWSFQPDPEIRTTPGSPWAAHCVAQTLNKFLAEEKLIQPKGKSTSRKVRPGDVAILCRTNKQCLEMAGALNHAGLKAALARGGLLRTAEAKLVIACLKFLLQQEDTLSVAEMLYLKEGISTEEILEDRFEFLRRIGDEKEQASWAEDFEVVRMVDELRNETREMSSSEMLRLLIDRLDLRRTVVSWGNPNQRLHNVDQMIRMSLEYEDACNRLHSAASLGGYLLWLDEKAREGNDQQGFVTTEDTVNVLTYHKSKGLEFPVVICDSLESGMREDVWGLSLEQLSSDVDLDNLLGNRWLRFWVNPYGDQVKGTPIFERIMESNEQEEITISALKEEARLLYVGMTRARDCLILPSRQKKPTKWLNRVWHGDESVPTLDPGISESPWEWDGKPVPIRHRVEIYPRDFPLSPQQEETLRFFQPVAGEKFHPPYLIEEGEGFPGVADKTLIKLLPRRLPDLEKWAESEVYGKLCELSGHWLKAQDTGRNAAEVEERLEDLMERFDLEDEEWTRQFGLMRQSFYDFLEELWPGAALKHQYPLQAMIENRLFKACPDLLLETKEEVLIIRIVETGLNEKEVPGHAAQYADWCFLAKESVNKLKSKKSRSLLYYPAAGILVELLIKD